MSPPNCRALLLLKFGFQSLSLSVTMLIQVSLLVVLGIRRPLFLHIRRLSSGAREAGPDFLPSRAQGAGLG